MDTWIHTLIESFSLVNKNLPSDVTIQLRVAVPVWQPRVLTLPCLRADPSGFAGGGRLAPSLVALAEKTRAQGLPPSCSPSVGAQRSQAQAAPGHRVAPRDWRVTIQCKHSVTGGEGAPSLPFSAPGLARPGSQICLPCRNPNPPPNFGRASKRGTL